MGEAYGMAVERMLLTFAEAGENVGAALCGQPV
jgi:hypothetical protein